MGAKMAKKTFGRLLTLLLLSASSVLAHPEGHHEPFSKREIAKREHLASKRHLAARNCAPVINDMLGIRRAKRSFSDQFILGDLDSDDGNAIQQHTCVTAPELMEGPYYVNNELVRQDIREDQAGVSLEINVAIIDIETCEPIPNAFVEIWSANATGVYGGFEGSKPNGPKGPGKTPEEWPMIMPHKGPHIHEAHRMMQVDDERDGQRKERLGRIPAGRRPAKYGGYEGIQHEEHMLERERERQRLPPPSRDDDKNPHRPGRGGDGPRHPPHASMTTNSTWLRGGYATDDSGVVELTTIFPGFYSGRTTHVHIMVRTGWEMADNGTLISSAGTLHHVGQVFFEESWNDEVLSREPYNWNTGKRTKNENDGEFKKALVDRNSAIIQLERAADDLEGGLIGFVTVGVDMTAEQAINSDNYNIVGAPEEDEN